MEFVILIDFGENNVAVNMFVGWSRGCGGGGGGGGHMYRAVRFDPGPICGQIE